MKKCWQAVSPTASSGHLEASPAYILSYAATYYMSFYVSADD